MQVIVKPLSVSGSIKAVPSKSSMQRACAAALLHEGETVLLNPGFSDDDKAALNIIQRLGAQVEHSNNQINIVSNGLYANSESIDCGESGLSVRMFTSIGAVSKNVIKVTGEGSLLKRPLRFFDDIFPQLGVQCQSNNGFLPLIIQGPLEPKNITIDGALSSQYLTGLLFAYAAVNAQDVSIKVENLNSKPYVDLTLDVLKHFNFKLPVNNNYSEFYFDSSPINQSTNKPINYTIEGDWSGAAFLLVAGAISGNILVRGLQLNSSQGDKTILQAIKKAGANIDTREQEIKIENNSLNAFEFDATDCPDLFPPLVALASHCRGVSKITGANRLVHKESNRAETLEKEFAKLGVSITVQNDSMVVTGSKIKGGVVVDSHGDHRIAMACAIAALGAEKEIVIENAEAVNKSYPQFWEHLKQLQHERSL